MAQYTSNFNLYKPSRNDNESVDQTLATNFETIDTELKNRKTELDTHKSSSAAHDSANITYGDTTVKVALDGTIDNANQALTNAVQAQNDSSTALEKATTAETNSDDALAKSEEALTNSSEALNTANSVESQFNKVVAEAGSSNPEVVLARGTYAQLKDRFAANETSLADITTNKIPLKADQTALNTTNQNVALKADKSYVDTQIGNIGNASPKGTYASLTDLQTAFPTGATGVYVVVADGKWYYWNGSAWTSGGIYQSTGIAFNSVIEDYLTDGSVGIRKTRFATVGKNMFNKVFAIANTLLFYTNGLTTNSSSYYVSDYIAIKNGVTYTINKCRNYALYNTSKQYLSGIDNPGLTSKTFTAPSDGFLRISLLNADLNGTQVEIGSSSTFYEEYSFNMSSLIVQNTNFKDGTIDPKKLITMVGKNMFDKSAVTSGYYLSTTNALSVSSTYSVSDFIPIKANTNYVINKSRDYVVFDINKNYIAGVDNSSMTPIVINRNADGYIRFSFYQTDLTTIQMELGTIPTPYSNYGVKITNLIPNDGTVTNDSLSADLQNTIKITTQNKLTVNKSGNVFSIRSQFDNVSDIVIDTNKFGSSNGTFNFVQTYTVDKDATTNMNVFHTNGDDITPIRTFSTVGANHGYTTIIRVTMAGHDKTISDLGSTWTDGVTTYTLLNIIGSDLILGCPYTVDGNSIVSSTYVAPVGALTPVSGATHTSAISVSTLVSSPQLFPSINNISVKYLLDGNDITNLSDGVYYGNELQVQESYNIMDYKAIIDYAQNHIGTSFANDSVSGVVRVSINYTFGKQGSCVINHNIRALRNVFLGECGFIQSAPITQNAKTLYRYMPNVTPYSGFDFKSIVDMSTYNVSLNYTASQFKVPSIPPNRIVDWLKDSSQNKSVGFAIGYFVDKSNAKHSDRLQNASVAWDMRDTKKIYPVALYNLTLNVGQYYNFSCYRNYLSPQWKPNASSFYIVRDKKDAYVYIDYHVNTSFDSIQLSDFIGKSITVLESENFTLVSNIVDADGVTFSISNGYGYAVLKLN